jgi:hemerythrin-like domain-containing protein
MASAIRMLQAEHDLILRALEAADHAAWRLEHGQPVPRASLPALLQFFSYVVHHSHRDKEEGLLFSALQEKGLPDAGEWLAGLTAEHEKCLVAFKGMATAADAYCGAATPMPSEGLRWARLARQYTAAVRRLLSREEQLLFGNAKQALKPKELEALAKEFKRIDESAQRSGLAEIMDAFERAAWDLRIVKE